jgi:predicted esterase
MYKCLTIVLLVSHTYLFSYAQSGKPIRYKDVVFDKVNVQKDISYYETEEPDVKSTRYLFDLYQPENDTCKKRPLVIWLHGGGFKFGNKTSGGLPLWSNMFASRGYVCATINYRLTKKNAAYNYRSYVKGCMNAIEDLHRAVKYFKENSALYRIDTNCIILGGNSAGGMIAIQAVYSNNVEMAQHISIDNSNVASQHHNPMQVKAVVNFWGAIFDIDWLKNTNVPIVSVHGKKDNVVNFTTKDSAFFGSGSIHVEADKLGIPNDIKVYDQYSHELQRFFFPLWFSEGTIERRRETGEFAADFLYRQLFEEKTMKEAVSKG